MFSKEFKKYVESLPIKEEYQNTFGRSLPTGKFFCPFHVNVHTPSAKVYGNHIRCFSCNRDYTTFDLLLRFNKDRLDYLSRSVMLSSNRLDVPKKFRVSYPDYRTLDLSGGVTLSLLDFICNYGSEKMG